MFHPWVMEELRAHPNRLLVLQALALLSFVITFVIRMPSNDVVVLVSPSESPRAASTKSSHSVRSNPIGVSKRVMGRLSEAPGRQASDPLPRRPVPSASPVATRSGPSEPSHVPSVQPSEPPPPSVSPSDLGPPSNEPDSSSEPIPSPSHSNKLPSIQPSPLVSK